ncbi:hypothetical protein NDU88_001135 [Pleurodeles waltl]|uniref:Uncharacterized protein n=1 Tax=Pleurodeles waltl TaxID=8319 RepID=A0AAV7P643_PLEWA|nr:hypothetical protein NDU88_001135 [Pleurodeles waltl]
MQKTAALTGEILQESESIQKSDAERLPCPSGPLTRLRPYRLTEPVPRVRKRRAPGERFPCFCEGGSQPRPVFAEAHLKCAVFCAPRAQADEDRRDSVVIVYPGGLERFEECPGVTSRHPLPQLGFGAAQWRRNPVPPGRGWRAANDHRRRGPGVSSHATRMRAAASCTPTMGGEPKRYPLFGSRVRASLAVLSSLPGPIEERSAGQCTLAYAGR